MSTKEESNSSSNERVRSRSPRPRSREHDHERTHHVSGRDTNSNDVKSVRCRIFVGNLFVDQGSKKEVEDLFCKFGEITSISLHKNYGFIQYMDEQSADQAVLEMHGKTLFEKRVDVNLAGVRRKIQAKDKYEGEIRREDVVPPNMVPLSAPPARNRSRSPMRSGHGDNYNRPLSPMSRYEELYRKDDPYGRPRYDHHGTADRLAYERPRDFPPERRMDPYALDRHEEIYPPRYERDYPPQEYTYKRFYDDNKPPQKSRPAIDLEIICLSKEESRYAEEVESRLRSIGLVCNIGYPPAEVSVLETVDRVARAGTLYAVVCSAQNAQHRSCTLNILHGTRQEHRNMPLDDALSFVARNFDTYLRVLRGPFRGPPQNVHGGREEYRGYPPPQAHLPADTKQLSTDELSDMIEKLKREKEEREKCEPGAASAASTDDPHRRAELESELHGLRQESTDRVQSADPSYQQPTYNAASATSGSYYQGYGQPAYR